MINDSLVLNILTVYPGIGSADVAMRAHTNPQEMRKYLEGMYTRGLVRHERSPRIENTWLWFVEKTV